VSRSSRSSIRSAAYGRGVVDLDPELDEPDALPAALVAEVSDLLHEELVGSEFHQPLLPASAVHALAAANSPDGSLRQIAWILKGDPGLAAEVLRAANATHYARARPAQTVQEALARVGLTRLRDVLLVASAGRVLRVPGDRAFGERLRLRSSAVAHTARAVAKAAGTDPDHAFTAGLLHDVGLAAFHALYPRVRLTSATSELGSREVRARLAAALHEEVGGALALNWKLPAPVAGAMAYHHRPHLAIFGLRMASTVAAACELVAVELGLPDEVGTDVASEALDRLQVPVEAQGRLRADLARKRSAR